MMVQTKCKLNNTELFLKLFHIQCTTKKQQNLKNGKVIFHLNFDIRKENGRLTAECHRMP